MSMNKDRQNGKTSTSTIVSEGNRTGQRKKSLGILSSASSQKQKSKGSRTIRFNSIVEPHLILAPLLGEFIDDYDLILVRHSRQRDKFLEESVNKYDIVSSDGKRLLYAKEMKGGSKQQSDGRILNMIIFLLSLDGEEVLRIEGYRGSGGVVVDLLDHMQKLLQLSLLLSQQQHEIHYDNERIGDIMDTNERHPGTRYDVVGSDDKTFAVIELSGQSKNGCLGRCKTCMSRSKAEAFFDIFSPNRRHTFGQMGTISHCQQKLSSKYKHGFGINFEEPLTSEEKSLLLAALFVLKIPLSATIDIVT